MGKEIILAIENFFFSSSDWISNCSAFKFTGSFFCSNLLWNPSYGFFLSVTALSRFRISICFFFINVISLLISWFCFYFVFLFSFNSLSMTFFWSLSIFMTIDLKYLSCKSAIWVSSRTFCQVIVFLWIQAMFPFLVWLVIFLLLKTVRWMLWYDNSGSEILSLPLPLLVLIVEACSWSFA